MARMYDRTGLSTKCTLIKHGFKNLRTGTEAKFRPSVDALDELFNSIKFTQKLRRNSVLPYASNVIRYL